MGDAGSLAEIEAAYSSRRRDLEERFVAAPTRGLAEAYRAQIEELDAAWVSAHAQGVQGAGGAHRDSEEAPVIVGAGGATAGMPAEWRDAAPLDEIEPEAARADPLLPVGDRERDELNLETETRLTARIAVFGGLAIAGAFAVGIAIAVLLGRHNSGGLVPPVVDRVAADKTERPLPVAVPPARSDEPERIVEAEPDRSVARQAAASARVAAEGARAAFESAPKPADMDRSGVARAELLVTRADAAEPLEAAPLYLEAADEYAGATRAAALALGSLAIEEARAAATRWETVPAEARGRWTDDLTAALARLDESARLVTGGDPGRGREEALAVRESLEALWIEYLVDAIGAARHEVQTAKAEWDVEFAPLARAGMSEPVEVAGVREWMDEPGADRGTTPEVLAALRGARASLERATGGLRADRAALDAARRAAALARERFELAPKSEGTLYPPADRGVELLAEVPAALRTSGPQGAIALYRQAADAFSEALALAEAAEGERSLSARRTALAGVEVLRANIEEIAVARAAAMQAEEQAVKEVDRLRAEVGRDPDRETAAQEQIAKAAARLRHASRVVSVLYGAGITESALGQLRDFAARAREAAEQGAALPAESMDDALAKARRLKDGAALVEGVVNSEAQAQRSLERWTSAASAAGERWKGLLREPTEQIEAGRRAIGAGELAEGGALLDAARGTLARLWDQFIEESLRDARAGARTALAEWDSFAAGLVPPLGSEPDGVGRARAVVGGDHAAFDGPESELGALQRAALDLRSLTSRVREERAAIGRASADAKTALFSAVRDGDLGAVKSLVAGGADIRGVSPEGETVLVLAVRLGRVQIARVLLQAGAERSQRAPDGRPLLFVGVASPEMLGLFLDEAGRTEFRGRTVLHEIAAAGVERKVSAPDQVTMAGMVLDRFPGLLGERDDMGLTALEIARQRGARPLVWFLSDWKK